MTTDSSKRKKSILIDGAKYYTFFSSKFDNRKNWEKPDERQIKSVIPGKILKIFVKEGQKVKEGQDLFIIEAMKMHNRVVAPINGVIKNMPVKVGENVPKDTLIIEFE